jgi:hypothetical protein
MKISGQTPKSYNVIWTGSHFSAGRVADIKLECCVGNAYEADLGKFTADKNGKFSKTTKYNCAGKAAIGAAPVWLAAFGAATPVTPLADSADANTPQATLAPCF